MIYSQPPVYLNTKAFGVTLAPGSALAPIQKNISHVYVEFSATMLIERRVSWAFCMKHKI
jgi:hypothetical protein